MNKYFKGILTSTMVIGLMLGGVVGVSADTVDNTKTTIEKTGEGLVVDEKWGMPVYVYGSKLTEQQVRELAESNGYKLEGLEVMSVDGKDMVEFLGEGNPDANMYSSAIITRTDKGAGIEVSIKDEERITKITEDQYTNAMITAGVEDAEVIVDSPVTVTGESALTGIYKAYAEKGEELDKDRMEVAQEELETTSSIATELDTDQKSALDDALIDIKQQLADLEKSQLTEENIEKIINKALELRGLDKVIGEDEVGKLVRLFSKYGKTGAVDSAAVKEQLSDLADSVGNKLGDLKDWAEDTNVKENTENFFKNVWDALTEFFGNIFGRDSE